MREYMQSVSSRPRWPDIRKSFVVLDAANGSELLRAPLGAASPVASMVVPGPHDDVFVSTRPALVRILSGVGKSAVATSTEKRVPPPSGVCASEETLRFP